MPWRRVLAGVLLVAVVLAYARMLARLRRDEEARGGHTSPWFGYARDGVNLCAGIGLVSALAVAGFGGPPSLLLGVLLGLAMYVLDWLLGKLLHSRFGTLAVMCFGCAAGLGLVAALPLVAGTVARLLAAAAAR
jgi:hypothetical protein